MTTTSRDIARALLIDDNIDGYRTITPDWGTNLIEIVNHQGHIVHLEDKNDVTTGDVFSLSWSLYLSRHEVHKNNPVVTGFSTLKEAHKDLTSLVDGNLDSGHVNSLGFSTGSEVEVSDDTDNEDPYREVIDSDTARSLLDQSDLDNSTLAWVDGEPDGFTGYVYSSRIVEKVYTDTTDDSPQELSISDGFVPHLAPLFAASPDLAYSVEYYGDIHNRVIDYLNQGKVMDIDTFWDITRDIRARL